MPISNFPASLQPIIQQGFLEHAFQEPLRSRLGFRAVAEREEFPGNIGETLTKTRTGLLAPTTTPINVQAVSPLSGAAATLDNGLTPDIWAVEQYTITLNEYGKTMNLNTKTQRVGIVNRFVQNMNKLGENAAHSLDQLARNALYDAYQGGTTTVRVASTSTAVPVDDIRGFQIVFVNGVQMMVSGTYPLAVLINGDPYTVTGVAADPTNVTTTFRGVSGVLTLSAAVSGTDGVAGAAVIAANAQPITRPNGRASQAALTASDNLTMATLLNAKLNLDNNGIPLIDEMANIYLSPTSARQLFADPDFRQLFQGATSENEIYRTGNVAEAPFLGMRFIRTTESPQQVHPTNPNLRIQRPIICGSGALIEADFGYGNGDAPDLDDDEGLTSTVDGVQMIVREPIDRLKQIITQSWYYLGGWCAPTDTTTTPTTVPTATQAAYKRATIIEHVETLRQGSRHAHARHAQAGSEGRRAQGFRRARCRDCTQCRRCAGC